MSTRGYIGLKKHEQLKGQYNHWDSYFSCLGREIICTINSIDKNKRIDTLNETYNNIILLNPRNKKSRKIVKEVFKKDDDYWYDLFAKYQGRLDLYVKGYKYMLDGNSFFKDTIWCDYAYIINLDDNTLDVYRHGKLKVSTNLLKLNYKRMERKVEKN